MICSEHIIMEDYPCKDVKDGLQEEKSKLQYQLEKSLEVSMEVSYVPKQEPQG